MNDDTLSRNRLILCHYDTYSSALLFARFGASVLAPVPLPEGTTPMPGTDHPGAAAPEYEPAAALEALGAHYGLDTSQLSVVDDFEEWMSNGGEPIRIHLARFTGFDAPRDAIEGHGGVFKPISDMRGTAMLELNLLRRVFNLMVGGG